MLTSNQITAISAVVDELRELENDYMSFAKALVHTVVKTFEMGVWIIQNTPSQQMAGISAANKVLIAGTCERVVSSLLRIAHNLAILNDSRKETCNILILNGEYNEAGRINCQFAATKRNADGIKDMIVRLSC